MKITKKEILEYKSSPKFKKNALNNLMGSISDEIEFSECDIIELLLFELKKQFQPKKSSKKLNPFQFVDLAQSKNKNKPNYLNSYYDDEENKYVSTDGFILRFIDKAPDCYNPDVPESNYFNSGLCFKPHYNCNKYPNYKQIILYKNCKEAKLTDLIIEDFIISSVKHENYVMLTLGDELEFKINYNFFYDMLNYINNNKLSYDQVIFKYREFDNCITQYEFKIGDINHTQIIVGMR